MGINRKFELLDGIRGFAAILVVIRHSESFFGGNPFYHSFLAVDIFFVLSGFVLAHAYDRKFLSGDLSVKQFAVIRLIRFYPMYILSTVLCFLLVGVEYFLQETITASQFIAYAESFLSTLLFLPSLTIPYNYNALLFPLNLAFWTLSYELYINIFYGYSRVYFNDYIVNSLLVLAGLGILIFAMKDGGINTGWYWGRDSIALGGARSFFGIFFGLKVYRLYQSRLSDVRIPYANWMPLVLIVSFLIMPDLGAYNWLFQSGCLFILFPACLLWGATASASGMYKRFLLTLGVISYPAYVLHIPVVKLINILFEDWSAYYAPLSGVFFIVLVVLLSLLSERFYDIPIRSMFARAYKDQQRRTKING